MGYKPIIGMTMGDVAGVGTEITAKALSNRAVYEICNPLVIGESMAMKDGIRIAKKNLKVNPVERVSESKFNYGEIDVLDLKNVVLPIEYGKISAEYGRAAGDYIKKAVDLAVEGEIDAIVTNPIHKESFRLGGWGEKYAGHTEMLADLTETKDYTMMLCHENFRVVHVTTHVSLRDACDLIKKDKVLKTIDIAYRGCRDIGIENPRIGVASLNPHAGEHGLFGREEIEEIAPAVEAARNKGYNVEGPVPGDTIFSKMLGGMYDIVVTQYHDQGHTPTKLLGFQYKDGRWDMRGINATLGLPIIRTSVDHGTAFGKAGKGYADEHSLIDAIELASLFAKNRNK